MASQRGWRPRGRTWRKIRRSAVVWWAVTIALGLATMSVVGSAIGKATQAAEDWGSSRSVWVVRRSVAAGEVFVHTDVALAERPRGVVPDGALDATTTPVGEASRVAVQPGEVVLTERLAGRGAHGVAAMVAPGFRAVALKNDETMPLVRQGDRVDVLATFDVGDELDGGASGDGGAAPSFAVASDAEVLSVSPRAITLAVDVKDAARVAFALAKASVTLALRGPGSASEIDGDYR
ncbi:MAG: Flp pilus assembly protein CpaB [Actinobacteria bacterium]|nr:Flp pilus assembly protein CpaB [Actinomycetota bacterium]